MAEMEAPQASGRKGRRGRGGGEEEENEGGGGRKKSGEGGVRGRGGSYGSSKGAWARERRMLGVLRSRRGSLPPSSLHEPCGRWLLGEAFRGC